VAIILCLLFNAAPVQAGPPTHQRVPGLTIGGLNHACGTTVDSRGDVYVTNAGGSEIKIFDPSRTPLASIANVEEPCALAVDGNGALYTSQRATGEVVRYTPNAYPFSGTPTYSGPTTIDTSGVSGGISVDPRDNRLYVADGGYISSYDSNGTLGLNEVQRVLCLECTSGTFTLSFGDEETVPLAWNATHTEIEAALQALATIGSSNVGVSQASFGFGPEDHLVTFKGARGSSNLELLQKNSTDLTGTLIVEERIEGFNGRIGEGDLAQATGVAAFTSSGGEHYIFSADAATDTIKAFRGSDMRFMSLHGEITGPKPGEDFGFGAADTYLAIDPGNPSTATKCISLDEQACTAGHLLVFDAAHGVVDEFEPNGTFLDRLSDPELTDSLPVAIAIDRSGGPNDGTIFLTSGSGSGSKVIAFGPLPIPSRSPLPELSHQLATAQAVATDARGYVYAAAGSVIHVFRPDGSEVAVGAEGNGISTLEPVHDLAVDSKGTVYMLGKVNTGTPAQEKVDYFVPSAYPPQDGTTYGGPATAATGNSFVEPPGFVTAIGLNPANDHVFITSYNGQVLELGAAAAGSPILDPCFACDLNLPRAEDIAVDGSSERVYLSGSFGTLFVVDSEGDEIIARITGVGSPNGSFGTAAIGSIAVDQTNGHVLVFNNARGAAEEYDQAGGYVGSFGSFTDDIARISSIAVDNACALHSPVLEDSSAACATLDPANENAYIAFDDTVGATDLWAFSPLAYGEAPFVVTGISNEISGSTATLRGTVDPRGFPVDECHFEYLTDEDYLTNGKTFAGAISMPCFESSEEIGHGNSPVAVHAPIAGITLGARYRFRLAAHNKYGDGIGVAGIFGPPAIVPLATQPILHAEATLRGELDPSGLETEYRFEYGPSEAYGQTTAWTAVPPSDGLKPIQKTLSGLDEGLEYHSRLVARNEVAEVTGSDQSFETSERLKGNACDNTSFRTGLSANLPDCRAYELVTPNGATPGTTIPGTAGQIFNNWLVKPRGEGAGDALAYFSGTLPGDEGTGGTDGYRAHRAPGLHPAAGWASDLFGPSFAQAGGGGANQHGVASDQSQWFWEIHNPEGLAEALPAGNYLRIEGDANSACSSIPESHFELVGCGSLTSDPKAEGRFVSPGGAHVIFFSKEHLEQSAAPPGTVTIYDRPAGSQGATVVSTKPDGSPFGASENATYLGTNEEGTATAFEADGNLFLHHNNQTVEVATGPHSYAGMSEDGRQVFFSSSANGELPTGIWVCKIDLGPCAGANSQAPTSIGPPDSKSIFVNVSADGSHVFFISNEILSGSETNEFGEEAQGSVPNLYVWNGATTTFIATLTAQDLQSFEGRAQENLARWTNAISAGSSIGRGDSPTRSTPNGAVLVFQSHAQLGFYENQDRGEIYRYEEGPTANQIICLSCSLTDAASGADAQLQVLNGGGVTEPTTVIPNVTDDGSAVFFQSVDRLIPEDANSTLDIYEWKKHEANQCDRSKGCLALISSGQGEKPSYLFSMSANGHDVFLETSEKLVGADETGTPSIYDAREDGGIPDPPVQEPCGGDACKKAQTPPPALHVTGDQTRSPQKATKPACKHGKHRVKGRCVAKRHKQQHRHQGANNLGAKR
jgi:hypothetical protein